MKKVVYIHGLGGSGEGSSAKNIRKMLEAEYELSASTYDLLQPKESFEKISEDVKGADLIVASSLGGFYTSALGEESIGNARIVLLNPCLVPQEAIEPILYEEQKPLFNKEKCLKEWNEIQSNWDSKNTGRNNHYFGVFADNDEYFHYKSVFDENIIPESGSGTNSAMISGKHEIAKDTLQLKSAFVASGILN